MSSATTTHLQFNDLLRIQSIDPKTVLVMRHRPTEPKFRRILPWLAGDRPDLYNAYQRMQSAREENMLLRAEYLASFIGHEAGKALFIGIFRQSGSTPMTRNDYQSCRSVRALIELGMGSWRPDDKRDRMQWFDLQPTDFLGKWSGRLVIDWTGGERSWARWSAKNAFRVDHIKEEPALDAEMPDWDELVITWDEIMILPQKWRANLSHWRGIYYIFDTSDGYGYVGSAYGDENILGRWQDYAASGHGGNKELRKRDPRCFRFSILQRVSPDMEAADIIDLESRWKARLHTREFGMNEN